MIHFFPRFSKSAEDTPFGQSLRATGVPHRIIGTAVPQTYSYRLQLLLIGYPKLICSALVTAVRSMFGRGQRPDAAVISSDVEALVFAFVRAMPFAAKPRIIFMPFIFTERRHVTLNRIRLVYYTFVMRQVSCAICHSRLEVDRYRSLFAGCGAEFIFVRWGGHVPSAADIAAHARPQIDAASCLVAAGRSGRDYRTLVAAAAQSGCNLTIICNEYAALNGVKPSTEVKVLTACFGMDYLAQLMQASIVVVPLKVTDISAGQMVLIQAMALAKPLIVTQTPTISDYLQHGINALLVPQGDVDEMAKAIRQLVDDPAAAAMMGRRAQADYNAQFSIQAHQSAVVRAIEQHCNVGGQAAAQSFEEKTGGAGFRTPG